jgi:hypothetical protein
MSNDRDIFKDEDDHKKYTEIFSDLEDKLIKLFSIGSMTEDEIMFARHLTTYVVQTVHNCVEIGMKKGMLPISKIDVWGRYIGEETQEFTYRLAAIGGQPYEQLKLLRISQLLEKAVVKWADETWGGVIESGQDVPKWIMDDDGEE